ncbi:uncharacterized protein LOC115120475 isoform X3 [Oncorhynchus nerka]|uniref:uncharacterized protein LOC115120475 isoform X3 n=1 Tax=Oncorhynchus nerka TaxID=8023 RepID=UPI0031B8101F
MGKQLPWNNSVTDLQVKETPGTEEGKVTLTCSTTCTLTDNPTYIWYKNGQLLTNPNTQDNYLYLDQISSGDAGSYSCSVKGYENLRSPVTFFGEPKSLKNAVVGIIVVILILILCLFGFMWFRKKASKSTSDTRDRRDTAENGQHRERSQTSRMILPTPASNTETRKCLWTPPSHRLSLRNRTRISSMLL